MARRVTPATRLARLWSVLEGAKTMLIVVQNNPDPDAIAAAAGLREIANEIHGIACSVAHAGTVGRAENQELLRYLGLNTRPIGDIDLDRFDRLGMVDAQPGAGNVKFDPSVRLDVVIDHHPIRRETRSARFTDVRRRYGATSSMLYEYLDAAQIEIPTRLATALVYGIRSDTQELGRESTRADLEAYLALYPLANTRALGRMVTAPLPHSYFSKLRLALDQAVVYGDRIVSDLGELDSRRGRVVVDVPRRHRRLDPPQPAYQRSRPQCREGGTQPRRPPGLRRRSPGARRGSDPDSERQRQTQDPEHDQGPDATLPPGHGRRRARVVAVRLTAPHAPIAVRAACRRSGTPCTARHPSDARHVW